MKQLLSLIAALSVILSANSQAVGIGTSTPTATARLEVINPNTNISSTAILATVGTVPGPVGGVATPTAVYGQSSTGIGVVGFSGGDHGVIGITVAPGLAGVLGRNTSASGFGVWGTVAGGGGIAGYFDGGSFGRGIIVPNGSVGIGTPTPGPFAKLHIKTPGSQNFDNVTIESPSGSVGFGLLFVNPVNTWAVGTNLGNFSDNRFSIINSNTLQSTLIVMPNGNTGIGTFLTPSTTFEVKSTRKTASLSYTDSLGGSSSVLNYLNQPAGFRGEYRASNNNDGMGVLGVATTSSAGYGIGVMGTGNWYGIAAVGKPGGTAAFFADANGATYAMNVSGTLTLNGNFTGSGINTYTSDRKLKRDIAPINSALAMIGQMKPSAYTFRNGEFGSMYLPEGKHYGLIAQELQELLPELVVKQNYMPADKKEKGFDYLAVNYNELIPILIKAMQEQQTEMELLKQKITELETKPQQ